MIEVFANRLDLKPKESYEVEGRQTVLLWLLDNGISPNVALDTLPMSVYKNGERLLPAQWKSEEFDQFDRIEIYREPKGTDPFSITFALIFGAKAVLSALMPKLPTTAGSGSQGQGKALDDASSKGNKVKINEIRPECLGFNPNRYPDYLVPPRQYYAAPREPRTEMLLAVGVGRYQIPVQSIKTGETPLLTLGNDAPFTIYQPGADLSADPAHLFWYLAPEVGSGSTGASGLELTATSALTSDAESPVFTFNDDVVGIPIGSGTFPADWPVGTLLNIAAPYNYIVTNGTGDDGRDIINGPVAQHNFVPGDTIQIGGDNEGLYIVHSVTDTELQLDYDSGTPGAGLLLGNVVMAMSYRGLRFTILETSANALRVGRLDSDGVLDEAWPGWDTLSSNVARVTIDSSNLIGGYRGPFPACPAGELITAIEVDIFYPSGLVRLTSSGEYLNLTGYQSFDYRDMAVGGGWTTAVIQARSNKLDAQGYTYRFNLPYPMRAEVRMRKIYQNQGGTSSKEYQDTMMWQRLKGLMISSSPTSYEGMTTMTTNIRGGDRLSSQGESLINLECTRILPVLRNGVWQAAQPTREISATVGHIVRDIGYDDVEDLDIAELEYLQTTRWTPRGETYDKIVNESDTVKGILIECLQAGFAEPTIDRGVITPVLDAARGPEFGHVYNPQVMLNPLKYEFEAPDQPDDFDGVDVEYFDHITKQNETVECRLPGDAGERVDKVKLEGIGDRTKAWRIGMRHRRAFVYRQRQYSFKTELDALNSGYLDYVALGVTTPGYGQSAEVVGYAPIGAGAMLEVSERMDWSQPGRHLVIVRRLDGTASGPHEATRVDDYRFTIPSLDFVPDIDGPYDRPIVQFGHESKWCYPALVTEVVPSGTKTCSVKAVGYDVRMFADDDNFPPD